MPHRAAISIADLLTDGLVMPEDAVPLEQVARDFRVTISPQMRTVAQNSPAVAAQFVPSKQELISHPDDKTDPIGDLVHAATAGLTHRYPDRAILHITKTCAVYCRFCFRRETVGDSGHLPPDEIAKAVDYLRKTPNIWEIILTGGDPLVLSARRLSDVITKLSSVPHLEVLRFHTRIPVVAPERINAALVKALESRLTPWIVLHINHADELTPQAQGAIFRLADAGVGLLSQTVLLRGVNDNLPALETLFRQLYKLRVKPYYLHHCDMARGAGHFRTTIEAGQTLMEGLRGRLSGPCMPTYVIDIPDGFGKAPLGPSYLTRLALGQWIIRDWQGQDHAYRDPAPY